jgi:hypothetical protein
MPLPGECVTNPEGERARDAGSLEGRYANYFEVGHNAFEFVLDFGQFYRHRDRVRHHTRIFTSPAHAKALLAVLKESMDRYERSFGVIVEEDEHEGKSAKGG